MLISPGRALCTAALSLSLPLAAVAQTKSAVQQQVVKPPQSQLWMDVATITMPGMPEMPDMPMQGLGSLFGGGGGKQTGNSVFGKTRGMMPGRFVDIAFATQRKPGGTEATQSVPQPTGLAPSLLLLPLKVERSASTPRSTDEREYTEPDEPMERPKGKILYYWGCGETVRPGQPRVVDFSKSPPTEWGRFLQGRATRERGAVARPGHALWPNDRDRRGFGRDASLTGDYALSGEGVPASLRFALGAPQSFMPPISLKESGSLAEVLKLSWQSVPHASAYFLNAMGGGEGNEGVEMVLWSSAEVPEFGMGLIDYATPANVERWLREKVLLAPTVTECAIPRGIFAKQDGPMLRMIAYGPELNLAYPPRPTDVAIPWEPEWAVRVRNKSTLMATLGEVGGGREAGGSRTAVSDCGPATAEESNSGGVGAMLGGNLGRAVEGALGGLFGKSKEPPKKPANDCAQRPAAR